MHAQIYAFIVLCVASASRGELAAHSNAIGHSVAKRTLAYGDSLFVVLAPGSNGGTILTAEQTRNGERLRSRRFLSFTVFQAALVDIDGDGAPELLLGVVKKTRYDPRLRRRLFVYSIEAGMLRPSWLGSRLGMPLRDFRVIAGEEGSRILTLERERGGSAAIGVWRWQRFGPRFLRYEARGLPQSKARRIFLTLKSKEMR